MCSRKHHIGTLSRLQVSDDNPFSEAQFKTLKYQPGFPGRFDDIAATIVFCRSFFPWYNTEHRHAGIAMLYEPYTRTCFASTHDTDIEHIVATSEAHDSELCAADRATRRRFAQDLRNLTLASPQVNRPQKSGKNAGEWVPNRNQCWFAGRVLEVKRAYGLTVDRREAAALERILLGSWGAVRRWLRENEFMHGLGPGPRKETAARRGERQKRRTGNGGAPGVDRFWNTVR